MKKTIFARLGALPLRHKIAAAGLWLSVGAVGAGSFPMSALFSAVQRAAGLALRREILPSGPNHRGSDGHRDAGGPESASMAPDRRGEKPGLERISYTGQKSESTSLSEERNREETLLGLTLAQIDQKIALLERGLQRSRRGKRHSGAEAQAFSGQLSTLRKQRVLISERLREERKYDSAVGSTVSETKQTAVLSAPKAALPLTAAASRTYLVGGSRGFLGMMVGLVIGLVYLGLALWRYRPIGSKELAALGLHAAVPVLGSVARIGP